MRVFLTGCHGYLGSLFAPELMRRGYDVLGLDTGFYSDRSLYRDGSGVPVTVVKDLRHLEEKDLEGLDAVVHMGELSNDPLGALAPNITHEINHAGSVRLAQLAKRAGVQRFVYMSSCSVYGVAGEDFVDEKSPVNPQTAYGECKILVERDLKALADRAFSPTVLRNATAYGASPRMRFDIVLNNLTAFAVTSGVIYLKSDGTPWRPIAHIEDISRAFIAALDAPEEVVFNEAFNVGYTRHNYRMREIADIVADVVPGCRIEVAPDAGPDKRSYRCSFEKIARMLPAFKPQWDARLGAEQLYAAYRHAALNSEEFEGPHYQRIGHIQRLMAEGILDPDLRHRRVYFRSHPQAAE
jgi:nucleoside-diphosphate-sugar epimerase